MLVANAVVDTDQPRLQVGENQMDDRQVLLGNLWITTLGNSEVLIAALTEASIAAPIVSNDQRSRRDGALDEPTEELYPKVDGAVKSRFLMRVGWVIIVHVYFTRPTDRRIV